MKISVRFLPFLTLLAAGGLTLPTLAQGPDTWVGTDALGRTLPTAAQTRPARSDRFVGIFYFLTQGSRAYYDRPQEHLDYNTYGDDPRVLRDNTQIIKQAGGDPVTKPEFWKDGGTYWWGQPAVGYFLADDPWVARKNLTMLADAGVDTLIFDVTNAPQYTTAYTTILDTAEQMRREGHPTPQFLFITYSSTGIVANSLYDAIYAKGRYKDLWFLWHSKPLMLGDPNGSSPVKDPPRPEVKQFFTWRTSWANTRGPSNDGKDEWQWIDTGDPQKFGWDDDPKVPEEVPVALGGWSSSDLGRSFQGGEKTGGKEPPLNARELTAQTDQGKFFSQQWQDALKIDPEFIFVTGWNEWTAGRQYQPGVPMLGQVTKAGQYFFVDEYNEEFSRDAMPMLGGHADNYYMQLTDGIRRFKGVHPAPEAHGFQTPKRMADWQAVFPVYDASGAVPPRDWPGWGGRHYVDNSGRNAIRTAKVACDAKNIYFYVRTAGALTPFTGKNWMQLLIDADQNPRTGWNGYDYVVNSRVLSATRTTLKRLPDGKVWAVPYTMHGSEMQVTIPRSLLGLTNLRRTQFDFHWADHVAIGGDPKTIADWWYVGSSAPDGRFNYRFIDLR
jgi:hypothetical protein